MKIEIEESPYGDKGAVYNGLLGMCQHWIYQLASFRDPRKTKEEADYLEKDICGYGILLDTGVEENVRKFLEIKQNARINKQRFANNLEIVMYMKTNDLWQTTPVTEAPDEN